MGMSLAEITQMVVDITDRGESSAAIQLAIAKATLKFHLADLWNRDMVELKVTPTVVDTLRLEIYVSSQLPGFRKINYANGYDDTTDPTHPAVMQQFHENSPASIRDNYGWRKTDIYYLAGDVLTFWSSAVPPKMLVGYWATPDVSLTKYKSWIADIIPFAIVDEASSEIFGSIGDDDEAKRRRDMFVPNLQLVRMQDVEAAGR